MNRRPPLWQSSRLVRKRGVVNSFGFEFVACAERHAPNDIAGVRVDGHEFGPRRLLAGKLCGGIPESRVKRSLPERTESAICNLIAVLCLIETATPRDVA